MNSRSLQLEIWYSIAQWKLEIIQSTNAMNEESIVRDDIMFHGLAQENVIWVWLQLQLSLSRALQLNLKGLPNKHFECLLINTDHWICLV